MKSLGYDTDMLKNAMQVYGAWIRYITFMLKIYDISAVCPGARPTKAYFDRIRNSMKIQNTLVYNIRGRSQRYFAHVTTVSLSWRVQNIVVIGRVYSKLEHSEFSSNFEFDRYMLSGTGARSPLVRD